MNAGVAACLLGERLATRSALSDADKLRVLDLYFEALRAVHAGQALDLDGLARWVPATLERGEHELLERRVLAIHRLKTAALPAAFARMGAIAGGGTADQVEEASPPRSSPRSSSRGAPAATSSGGAGTCPGGKVSLPVAKALRHLGPTAGRELWDVIASRQPDPAASASAIARVEASGALDACLAEAAIVVDAAWEPLAPLLDASHTKLMLRAFGWYVLERR